MKIRIKRANTETASDVAFWLDTRQWRRVMDYIDELRQHAQWHN